MSDRPATPATNPLPLQVLLRARQCVPCRRADYSAVGNRGDDIRALEPARQAPCEQCGALLTLGREHDFTWHGIFVVGTSLGLPTLGLAMGGWRGLLAGIVFVLVVAQAFNLWVRREVRCG